MGFVRDIFLSMVSFFRRHGRTGIKKNSGNADEIDQPLSAPCFLYPGVIPSCFFCAFGDKHYLLELEWKLERNF